jgi:hypothetical protein
MDFYLLSRANLHFEKHAVYIVFIEEKRKFQGDTNTGGTARLAAEVADSCNHAMRVWHSFPACRNYPVAYRLERR